MKNKIVKSCFLICFGFLMHSSFAYAHEDDLREPYLKMSPSQDKQYRVALTLDACCGSVDWRILNGLVDNKIPATLFLTERWLLNQENSQAIAFIRQHLDLFQIENHGAEHIPAVDRPELIYGIKSAQNMEGVIKEVSGGDKAIKNQKFPQPTWFRGATAKYTVTAIEKIRSMKFKIAGFSLNGDEGATLSKQAASERIAAAEDGDVIIAHMNQPKREAGAGVLEGILALKERGFHFVQLKDNLSYIGADGMTKFPEEDSMEP